VGQPSRGNVTVTWLLPDQSKRYRCPDPDGEKLLEINAFRVEGVVMRVTRVDCPEAAVRGELRRVLKSANFEASGRNKRFLEYVVEEALAGRSDHLKAYTIATLVFGRPDDFDPQADPVVRMEARRLRRALERFYLVEGEDRSGVRLSLPKGGYAPAFHKPADLGFENGDPKPAPSLTVAAFQTEGPPPLTFVGLSRGLTLRIMVELHHAGECVECDSEVAGVASFESGSDRTQSGLILTGCLAVVDEQMSASALLLDAKTSRVCCGEGGSIRRSNQG